MKWGLLVLVAACYAPHPPAGSPCDQGPCPVGLVCSPASLTCELVAVDASLAHDVTILIDGCTPAPEICGNGSDEDCDGQDAPCPENDTAGGAIDVTAGGSFTANVAAATDDAPNDGCNGLGGRDVFYTVTVGAPEVYYFATFDSNFATAVRVFPGKTCGAIAGTPTCTDHDCGGAQSQLAMQLPAGTSCIVVDQAADETHGALMLVVKRGHRPGTVLANGSHTMTGDTCNGTNASQPPNGCGDGDGNMAKDLAYYFTACPSETLHLDASTCADASQTHFDTELYVQPVGGMTLDCNDDDDTCAARSERPDHPDGSKLRDVAAAGPDLFWLTVDGYDGACGGYRLVTTLD